MTRWDAMSAQERYDDLKVNHLKGHPVSASTYSNHGCRCAGCCHDNTQKINAYLRSHPAARRRKNARTKVYSYGRTR